MMTPVSMRQIGAALLVTAMALGGCGGEGTMSSTPIASAPTPTPSPSPSPTGGTWQLVWADDFDGAALDTARWNMTADCWGGGNNEQQCYTARPENISLQNGVLSLTARQESYTGDAWSAEVKAFQANPNAQRTQPFTSGKITTKGNASWLYGRFEMRARLPQGQGTWPAFWMMPEDNHYGGWPLSGEIDIFEAVNLGVICPSCEDGGEQSVLGTLHYGDRPPGNIYRNREIAFPGVLDGEFHTYGVVWEQGRFIWSIDGEPFGSIEASEWFTAASEDPIAPFDRPFHLILNFAVGGNWPENTSAGGVSTDNFPKQMEVDWVRVWQCDTDPATGLGCTGGM